MVFVEGRLDHAASADFERDLRQLTNSATIVIVDLSGIDYLSSAGLKVLTALADRQSSQGGSVRLRAPSIAARLALELSGLDGLVEETGKPSV